MGFNSPQNVLIELAKAFYQDRDLTAVLSCVSDDIEWVGTEIDETAKGKEQLAKLLEDNFARFPDPLSTKLSTPSIQFMNQEIALLAIEGTKVPSKNAPNSFYFRVTVCCRKEHEDWLIFNLHASTPNSEYEKTALHKSLAEEKAKQKALLDNIPGGIAMYRLKKDGRIATDYVSEGLAKICGYEDSEEIREVISYDVQKIILPEDWPLIVKACNESLQTGAPTNISYRVYRKDGTLVHITLDAIIMKNAKLAEDDVAVFYAVQVLVSEEASRKAEEQKKLINLLNTVPAGIGVFEVNKDGVYQNYLNDAFYGLISTTREARSAYFGDKVLNSAHPSDIIKLKQSMQRMLDGEDNIQLDYRLLDGNQNYVWLHMTTSVVNRTKDHITVYSAYTEFSETKKQQLELLHHQRAVDLAQKQGRISIWTYNIDKKQITQQNLFDNNGYMGYPTIINNVPNSFITNGCIDPADIDKFLATYQRLDQGDEKADSLYRLKNLESGKFDWIHMYYQRMESNEDDDRMAVGFSLQVNEQQEAIERYQIEEKVREQMYAQAIVCIEFNLTANQYVENHNLDDKYNKSSWERLTKKEYRENMSSIVDDAYLDEVVEKMYAKNLLTAFNNGETKVSCEYRCKEYPQKPIRWYRITAIMVKKPGTENVVAFIYVEDIEEEKNRQIAIECSMSDGIEHVAIIRISDADTVTVKENGANIPEKYHHHFTYDDQFVSLSHKAVIASERDFSYQAALLSTVKKELEKQEVYQYSISMQRDNEPLKRWLFRFRYLDDRKTYIIISTSDITSVYMEDMAKKKQLEQALKEAQNASNAKTAFYSRMSHDMRTPMNGILGMADLSKNETDLIKLKDNIRKIEESGEYLLNLINDTLDLQRIESGKMKLEPTIVLTTEVVRNVMEMVSVTAKAKGVQLKYDSGNADLNWYIRIDALRLKQIFINLLSNAIKFTPAGGTVELEFKLVKREGMISHDVIYVRDTGIGMSEKFIHEGIFKPFSQESNEVSTNYAGSGLGLSIAKSLIELMGGTIEVESTLGVGTTFIVHLDFERVDEKVAQGFLQSEQKQSQDVSTSLKGKKVLLVEDQALNAEIATRQLQNVGCEVVWVQNGQLAVDEFKQSAVNSYDAILMDIRMPVMDGLEASRKIRESDKKDAKNIPIIAMTANAYEEDRQAAFKAGMNAHLGKPIEIKQLYDTLAKCLMKN